jgi:hypothetical protein
MTKVPESVMSGKSPIKTSCSLTSPVSFTMKRTFTNSGAAYVLSLDMHSSTETGGSSKRPSPNSTA